MMVHLDKEKSNCSICGLFGTLAKSNISRKTNKQLYRSWCIPCEKERKDTWRKENKTRHNLIWFVVYIHQKIYNYYQKVLILLKGILGMIRKTSEGYKVTSEKGKNMSKKNLTKGQAEKRLAQIEWFKHQPKGKK